MQFNLELLLQEIVTLWFLSRILSKLIMRSVLLLLLSLLLLLLLSFACARASKLKTRLIIFAELRIQHSLFLSNSHWPLQAADLCPSVPKKTPSP